MAIAMSAQNLLLPCKQRLAGAVLPCKSQTCCHPASRDLWGVWGIDNVGTDVMGNVGTDNVGRDNVGNVGRGNMGRDNVGNVGRDNAGNVGRAQGCVGVVDVGMVGSCQVNDGTSCTNMTTWSMYCHKIYKDPSFCCQLVPLSSHLPYLTSYYCSYNCMYCYSTYS